MKMLALALLGTAALTSSASAQVPVPTPTAPVQSGGTRLTVVAEGEATRVPDLVTISAGVVTQAPTARAAMAQNAAAMTRTMAALRQAGVAERDIRTDSLGLQPQYRYADNQPPVITGYQASNRVSVRFRDVAKAGSILDALVESGANQIEGPQFGLDQPAAAMDEARVDAIRKARARADLYARAAGMQVARIVDISELSLAEPPRPLAGLRVQSMKADATTEIAPGEQTQSVSVTVVFELR